MENAKITGQILSMVKIDGYYEPMYDSESLVTTGSERVPTVTFILQETPDIKDIALMNTEIRYGKKAVEEMQHKNSKYFYDVTVARMGGEEHLLYGSVAISDGHHPTYYMEIPEESHDTIYNSLNAQCRELFGKGCTEMLDESEKRIGEYGKTWGFPEEQKKVEINGTALKKIMDYTWESDSAFASMQGGTDVTQGTGRKSYYFGRSNAFNTIFDEIEYEFGGKIPRAGESATITLNRAKDLTYYIKRSIAEIELKKDEYDDPDKFLAGLHDACITASRLTGLDIAPNILTRERAKLLPENAKIEDIFMPMHETLREIMSLPVNEQVRVIEDSEAGMSSNENPWTKLMEYSEALEAKYKAMEIADGKFRIEAEAYNKLSEYKVRTDSKSREYISSIFFNERFKMTPEKQGEADFVNGQAKAYSVLAKALESEGMKGREDLTLTQEAAHVLYSEMKNLAEEIKVQGPRYSGLNKKNEHSDKFIEGVESALDVVLRETGLDIFAEQEKEHDVGDNEDIEV